MRKLLLALSLVGLCAFPWLLPPSPVEAQNTQCSDRPAGDSSNACADTRFVGAAVASATNVTNHALAIGRGPGQPLASAGPCTASQIALWVSGVTGDPSCTSTLPTTLNVRLTIPSTSYFVDDINGNDSNPCTAATTGACKTLNGVVTRIGAFDLNYQAVTVNAAAPAASYAGMSCLQPWVGYGTVTFVGNTTTPTNVLVAGGASPAFDIENGCIVNLRGFSVSSSTGPASVQALLGAKILMTRMDLAAAPTNGEAVYSSRSSYVEIADTLGVTTIHTGTAAFYLFQASHGGELRIVCTTACLSLTGNITVGQYVLLSDHGDIVATPSASFALNTFAVTGNQFNAISTGSIQWNGNFPPNNADVPGTNGSGVVCNGSGPGTGGPTLCNFGSSGATTTFTETIVGNAGDIWRNQANNAELARLTNTGLLGIGNNNPQYNVSVSQNVTQGVVGANPNTNTVLQLIGKDTFQPVLELNSFGAQAIVAGVRADGTAASKSTIAAADENLYGNFGYGYNGSSYIPAAGFFMRSSEAYTGTKTGGYYTFFTTPTGTTGIVEALRFQPSGGISVGNVTVDPGAGSVSGSGTVASGIPVSSASTTRTIGATEGTSIFTAAGTVTATLPTPTNFPGRWWHAKTTTAQLANSATANVVPKVGGAAATSILPATIGAWAVLQSDGVNWIIMLSGT